MFFIEPEPETAVVGGSGWWPRLDINVFPVSIGGSVLVACRGLRVGAPTGSCEHGYHARETFPRYRGAKRPDIGIVGECSWGRNIKRITV